MASLRKLSGVNSIVPFQYGFSSIKVGIALTIFGFIGSVILIGNNMLENTKTKNIYNQYRDLSAAVVNYYRRYGVLPGDDLSVAKRALPAGSYPFAAGNGNGYVDGEGILNCRTPHSTIEACQLLYQIRQVGLIEGNDAQAPIHAYGGRVGVNRSSNSINGTNLPAIFCFENLSNKTARALETKFDDGVFNTGTIRGNANYANGSIQKIDASRTCMFS